MSRLKPLRTDGVPFLRRPGKLPATQQWQRKLSSRKSQLSSCESSSSNANKSVLFFGSYWPDLKASGAGVRTSSLLGAFIERWGYSRATYASPARDNQAAERLRQQGIITTPCVMNRESNIASVLEESGPCTVVFDRFTAEEQYSWIVRSVAPNALRVLDMQDSHALRLWREHCILKGSTPLPEILSSVPDATWPLLQRELASILRSDLTLVCSNAEMALLQNYGVPRDKLCLAPFFYPEPEPAASNPPSLSFEERETGFVTIGTFCHNPNVDGIRWLAKEVWPLIRKQSDKFEMHIYGAHLDRAPGDVKQLHNPEKGFHLLGFADSVEDVLGKSKVLLAPLRFGAGLKTKILDAWRVGLPVVTTPIGSEGIHVARSPGSLTYTAFDWGGFGRATSAEEFAQDAIQLHEDRQLWNSASRRGLEMVSEGFSADRNLQKVQRALMEKQDNLQEIRSRDFVGQTLWHNNLRATEYFSRWVEMKETSK